ncbi:hypothetical protein Syun_000756 [Stephania yunnanensis]|uniref:Carboxypeptidase n=1 Tax=Stephania yunnanensis TaxID=152371 RepID=A0AAP0LCT8_9MAGN
MAKLVIIVIFSALSLLLQSNLSSATLVLPKSQAETLIRQLNLLPTDADPVLDDRSVLSDKKIVEKRFRLPNLDEGISVEDLGHHAGYYKLPHSHDARSAFRNPSCCEFVIPCYVDCGVWRRISSRNSTDDPVVIWLTGGPGCSSELALFYENGPFKIADNLSLILNEYGWDKVSNLIYVDQPTGTGFSYSSDRRDLRHDETGVSNDLYDFLQVSFQMTLEKELKDVSPSILVMTGSCFAFFIEHPQFAKNDFFITGESYAGHYIPAFAARVHQGNKAKEGLHVNLKGFAIGNGLTDPAIQYQAYTDYALDMGIIQESDRNRINKILPACELAIKLCGTDGKITCAASFLICNTIFASILNRAGNINHYDIRKKCVGQLCYDFSNLIKFLNQKPVRHALGVGDIEFVSCSPAVYQGMLMDWMRNLEIGIPALLEDGVKLLVYAGEYDLICNWLGNYRWVNAMEWSGQQNFTANPNVPFNVDGAEAGLLKSYGPLSFLKVHDAGHMVPMDQPKAALEMLTRWTRGELSDADTDAGLLKMVTDF